MKVADLQHKYIWPSWHLFLWSTSIRHLKSYLIDAIEIGNHVDKPLFSRDVHSQKEQIQNDIHVELPLKLSLHAMPPPKLDLHENTRLQLVHLNHVYQLHHINLSGGPK